MSPSLKKYITSLAVCGVLLAGGIGVVWFTQSRSTQPQAVLHRSDYLLYMGKKGLSALTELKQVARITTENSSYGEFVTAINGVSGGTNGNYWDYYVNGKLASVGAGAYILAGGEKVEWKLEK
jgi:hypothetical protein